MGVGKVGLNFWGFGCKALALPSKTSVYSPD